ncbi:MAG: ADP-ribosyl-[dinitrogen reductase] hydrolase [Sphaerotilus natans]
MPAPTPLPGLPGLPELLDRALGAYLGLALGDALGATVEFLRPREIEARHGVHREIVGGGWLRLAPGQVTDDTTMSLALGEALLACGAGTLARHADGRDEAGLWPRAVGDAFVRWWRGRPVDCGNTCRRGIQRYLRDGSVAGPPSEGDGGNGALMRNLPVLLVTLGDDAAMQALSIAQARLTHHHPLSDQATVGLGRLAQAQLLGAPGAEIDAMARQWADTHRAFRFEPWPGRASGYVVDTVQTVLHALTTQPDFESAVVRAVNQGDDADTTGALVGLLAGARCGARALPARWLRRLQPQVLHDITDQTVALLALAREMRALRP